MRNRIPFRRLGAAAALAAALGVAAGCSDVLEVNNPGAVNDPDLDLPENIALLSKAPLAAFQLAIDDIGFFGGVLTDEVLTGHNFNGIIDMDLRIIKEDNTSLPSIYNPIQRMRHVGEQVADRLKAQPDSLRRVDVAFALTVAGWGNEYLAEYFCESPVSPTGAALSSAQISERAVAYFTEALTLAHPDSAAARASVPGEDVVNLANLGLARAYLQLGRKADAAAAAAKVDPDWSFRIRYSPNSTAENNTFFDATQGSNRNLGVDVRFRNLNDPRIRHASADSVGHNRSTRLFTPYLTRLFEGWTPTTLAIWSRDTDMFAFQGLEARYIRAEAEGATALTRTLVNERRAVGGQGPLAPTATADQVMAELREQKARDFYLGGTRLGDLRRYAAQGVDDPRHVFPSGAYPNALFGGYEDDTCFIPTAAERVGNPNY
ncbi:MAG TPA: hypothetical protein VHG91_12235 [Longimicrobium sp.]|nr:hypothetical protein [Longimicrobium sp.]